MTAEIAIMNKIGVALAADSAVTLGGAEGKIYTSADKLFQLSTHAPVGIMVYGSTNFVGVPWETIIKIIRKKLGGKTYVNIEGYANRFINFLKENPSMFSSSLQINEAEELLLILLLSTRNDIHVKLEEVEQTNSKISVEKIKEITSKVIKDEIEIVRKQERIPGLPKQIRATLRRKIGPSIKSMQKEIFAKLPMTPNAKRTLFTMCIEVLTRAVLSPSHSGVVIAGFWEKEYTPTLLEIDIDGMIENRPRYLIRKKHVIDNNTRSTIIPFAQKEVVYTFMEGIDPRIEDMIHKTTYSLFLGVVVSIIKEVKEQGAKVNRKLQREIKGAVKKLLDDLFKKWNSERRKVHWGPVTTIVSALPKDELAAMAESLVNLTKFRRRVSTEKETVGGPIDVAVITKGDGFIWVKRKHYFEPLLNPRTMGRYLKEAL